jgi:hypothetical protein
VIHTVPAGRHVLVRSILGPSSHARTMLVWRAGYGSTALEALRQEVARRSPAQRERR